MTIPKFTAGEKKKKKTQTINYSHKLLQGFSTFLPDGIDDRLASLNLFFRYRYPREVQAPPETSHTVGPSITILKCVVVYEIYLWAHYSSSILLNSAKQRLYPAEKNSTVKSTGEILYRRSSMCKNKHGKGKQINK